MDIREMAQKAKLLRETAQMTQEDLARETGFHRVTIARLEAGKPVTRRVVLWVAAALQVDAAELMGEEPDTIIVNGETVLVNPPPQMVDLEIARRVREMRRSYGDGGRLRIPVRSREEPEGPDLEYVMIPPTFLPGTVTRAIAHRNLIATEATNSQQGPDVQAGDLVIVEMGAKPGDGVGLYRTSGKSTSFGRETDRPGECIGRAVAVLRRL